MAQAITDSKKAVHLFGTDAPTILNNVQTKSLALKSMQGFSYRNNHKRNLAVKNSNNATRRTLSETIQEIESNSIDLNAIAHSESPQKAYHNHPVIAKHSDKTFHCLYTGTDLGVNDSGRYSYVKWIRQQSLTIADNAVMHMIKTSRPISIQVDYLYNKFEGDNAVIGQGGITDIWQQYHNTVLDYNKSESIDGSLRMMKDILSLLLIATFNVTGSCYEAKKYACLFFKKYPMNNERCFENVHKADKQKKRDLLVKDVKQSYHICVDCSFPKDDGSYLHKAPCSDPYYK